MKPGYETNMKPCLKPAWNRAWNQRAETMPVVVKISTQGYETGMRPRHQGMKHDLTALVKPGYETAVARPVWNRGMKPGYETNLWNRYETGMKPVRKTAWFHTPLKMAHIYIYVYI